MGFRYGGKAAESAESHLSAASGTGRGTRTLADPAAGSLLRVIKARLNLGGRFESAYAAAQRVVIQGRTRQLQSLQDATGYPGRVRYLHEAGRSSVFDHDTWEIIIRQHAFYEPGGLKSVFLHEMAHSRLPRGIPEIDVDFEAVRIAEEFFGHSDDIILPFAN